MYVLPFDLGSLSYCIRFTMPDWPFVKGREEKKIKNDP